MHSRTATLFATLGMLLSTSPTLFPPRFSPRIGQNLRPSSLHRRHTGDSGDTSWGCYKSTGFLILPISWHREMTLETMTRAAFGFSYRRGRLPPGATSCSHDDLFEESNHLFLLNTQCHINLLWLPPSLQHPCYCICIAKLAAAALCVPCWRHRASCALGAWLHNYLRGYFYR